MPPPPLAPFLNRTRCPADELIILEILFLLLIPPFYEQLSFYGAMDLTPAWSHSNQSVRGGGGGGGDVREKALVYFFVYVPLFHLF